MAINPSMSVVKDHKVMVIGNWDLGLAIVNALISANTTSNGSGHRISVLTSPSQTLSLLPHPSSETVLHKKSDFSFASLQEAFKGQDVIISTMYGGDHELQTRIIDAAIAAGVRRFIPHEFGHDSMNKGIQLRVTKYSGRAKVIEYLRETSTTNLDFEWVAIATGYTLDKGLISGDLGFDLKWHSATIHGVEDEPFPASSIQRVGVTVPLVLQKWGQLKNTYVYAAGVITSANEVLKALERVTCAEWTLGDCNVDDCVREGQSRIERGFPDAGMTLLERSVLYDAQLDGHAPFLRKGVNKLLGLDSESAEVIVDAAYHDFNHFGKPGCDCSS